jgi:hypothetical protein
MIFIGWVSDCHIINCVCKIPLVIIHCELRNLGVQICSQNHHLFGHTLRYLPQYELNLQCLSYIQWQTIVFCV